MSLAIPAGENPGGGLHAVLVDLARQALCDAEQIDSDPEGRTHAIRTGMKKFRALLRLAKRVVERGQRRELLRLIAEMKDSLSRARDQVVIAEIAGEVLGKADVAANPESSEGVAKEELAQLAETLEQRTRNLNLGGLDAGALCKRWKRTCRRVRKAGRRARKSDAAAEFHRWRKGVKDLWYQSEALAALSDAAAALVEPAKTLSGILGKEHDLTLAMESLKDLSKADCRKLAKRRKKCRRRAFAVASDL